MKYCAAAARHKAGLKEGSGVYALTYVVVSWDTSKAIFNICDISFFHVIQMFSCIYAFNLIYWNKIYHFCTVVFFFLVYVDVLIQF